MPSRIGCWNCDPVDVGDRGGSGRTRLDRSRVGAGVLAGPGQRDRLVAVEGVLALLQLQVEGRRPRRSSRRSSGTFDLDAADRVDELAEAVEVDDRDVVDVDAEEVLDRPDGQLRAAERVGGVDLVLRPGRGSSRACRGGSRACGSRRRRRGSASDRVGAVGRAVGRRRLAAPGGVEAALRRPPRPGPRTGPSGCRCRSRGSSAG